MDIHGRKITKEQKGTSNGINVREKREHKWKFYNNRKRKGENLEVDSNSGKEKINSSV